MRLKAEHYGSLDLVTICQLVLPSLYRSMKPTYYHLGCSLLDSSIDEAVKPKFFTVLRAVSATVEF